VGLRDAGTARGPSRRTPDRGSLDLGAGTWADTEGPLILLSAAGSATLALGARGGAWIESVKVLPAWMGGETGGARGGSSEIGSEVGGGASSGGLVIGGGVRSEVEAREELGACKSVGGEEEPGCEGGSDNPEEDSCLSSPTDDGGGAEATSTPIPSSVLFTRGAGTRFPIFGDSEPEPEPTDGEGVDLSKF
jgi:hypothetical protein